MAFSSNECAVAEDGSLLDATKIVFYNDPDDDVPLPNLADSFFQAGHAPSTLGAGSRRSGRATRPSARIMDPDNTEGPMSAIMSRKRSATVTTSTEASLRAARRAKLIPDLETIGVDEELLDFDEVIAAAEDGEGEMKDTTDEDSDGEGETDNEQAEEAYRNTKAMGNADRLVN